MLIALGCMTLVALSLAALLLYQLRVQASERYQVAHERGMLLERIQRPERVPVVAPQEYVIPEQEPDEFHLVGAIHNDPEAYLRSELPEMALSLDTDSFD